MTKLFFFWIYSWIKLLIEPNGVKIWLSSFHTFGVNLFKTDLCICIVANMNGALKCDKTWRLLGWWVYCGDYQSCDWLLVFSATSEGFSYFIKYETKKMGSSFSHTHLWNFICLNPPQSFYLNVQRGWCEKPDSCTGMEKGTASSHCEDHKERNWSITAGIEMKTRCRKIHWWYQRVTSDDKIWEAEAELSPTSQIPAKSGFLHLITGNILFFITCC